MLLLGRGDGSGAASGMSVPQPIGLLRSSMMPGEQPEVVSPAHPPTQATGCVRAGRGARQTPAQGSLQGAVPGPLSLPSPAHWPSISERGCSSSQAPEGEHAGVRSVTALARRAGAGGQGRFFAYCHEEPCPGVLGEEPGLVSMSPVCPCRTLRRATWRRLRRCTRRCTRHGKR